eukprot:COSAG06_NODE_3619_length_5112_cov_13.003591_3_plen_82_part_00
MAHARTASLMEVVPCLWIPLIVRPPLRTTTATTRSRDLSLLRRLLPPSTATAIAAGGRVVRACGALFASHVCYHALEASAE